ncbi:MAG: beta-propeller fold lactonase family protein [Candidatus Saliniplasma sp.]
MDEYLLVLNKDEDNVSVIDIEKKETVKKIDTGHNPHEIAVTPDGRKSYVTCSLGNEIDVIDNETFEIVKRIEHEKFDFPHGVGLTKDGKKLYVASTYSSIIFVIDTDTDEITNHFPTYQEHSHMITFSSDGRKVFIPNIGSDNMTVVDVGKEKVVNHFPVGGGPEGTAVHDKSGLLYVANQKDGTLYVFDTENYEIQYKRRLGTTPVRIIFSPDEKYAFIPNRESDDVSVVQTDFERDGEIVPWEIKRIPVGIWPGGVVFDESGEKAFVANNKTNDISVIEVEKLEETGRIDAGIHPDGIAYLKK